MRAYRHATWPEREAMHDAIAACKADAIAARIDLGRRYLDAHAGADTLRAIDVPFERAVERWISSTRRAPRAKKQLP